MKKTTIFITLFLIYIGFVIADTSVHPLTRGFADTLYCKLTGCEMTGDIDMQGNEIKNVNLSNVNVINISGINDTHIEGTPPWLYDNFFNMFFNESHYNTSTNSLIDFSIKQLKDDAWVNLTINSTDAYFRWNASNQTLELWVNQELQQDWGASTTIYQTATFLDNAFFNNIFLESAAGDAMILNTTLIVVGNTTSTFYFGDGRYLDSVCLSNGTNCNQSFISFPSGKSGASPWLYNDSNTIYFNETHYNVSTQDLAEVRTYVEYINFTSSGGSYSAKSSSLIDFQITRITVTPNSLATQYRFEAVKDSNGEIIDKDRVKHTGVWDIEKAVAIDNDYVNISLTQINPDDTFSVKITYIDNFRP